MDFPIFKTKIKGETQVFDLLSAQGQKEYLEAKAGPEIKKLRTYLKDHSFIVYFLGKKNSGKGTYSKLFIDTIGQEYATHLSIGDLVRKVEAECSDKKQRDELRDFLKKNYRGYISIDEVLQSFHQRSTKTLLPTEFILALVKREIGRMKRQTIFIDGFPRNLDQISYSLFFRDLIGYRDDPDIFCLIDLPETVIDERIKYRVVCPQCQRVKNLKLYSPSQEHIKYDKLKKEFYFICDNPECKDVRMIRKEGDEQGIEPIKNRLKLDEALIEKAFSLHGIPKIFLRNSLPVQGAEECVDKYEITPEYIYQWNEASQEVEIIEKPWLINDDQGVSSYSLLPSAVFLSMLKQLADIFHL